MTINMGRTHDRSTATTDSLTHVGAVGRFVVNATVTPLPGPGTNPPVAYLRTHGADGRGGYGVTTDSAADLFAAGRALIEAGELLLQAQQAAEAREL